MAYSFLFLYKVFCSCLLSSILGISAFTLWFAKRNLELFLPSYFFQAICWNKHFDRPLLSFIPHPSLVPTFDVLTFPTSVRFLSLPLHLPTSECTSSRMAVWEHKISVGHQGRGRQKALLWDWHKYFLLSLILANQWERAVRSRYMPR